MSAFLPPPSVGISIEIHSALGDLLLLMASVPMQQIKILLLYVKSTLLASASLGILRYHLSTFKLLCLV